MNYWKEFPLSFDECGNCGTTFSNPMPSDEAISLGNEALVRLYQKHKTEDQEFREARQAYLRGKMLAKRLMKWKKGGSALELGCYHGFFSLGLKEHSDWNVEGLEISEKLGKFINKTLKLKCHVGILENLNLQENAYDFIICHDLIEHINQPQVFLSQLARILKPNGRIQIITPNVVQDLAFAKRMYAKGIVPTTLLNHILYFSPKAAQLALAKAGLSTRRLFMYDIRHALKDFGIFGLGRPPEAIKAPPSARATIEGPFNDTLSFWNERTLEGLRNHRKVSTIYGFMKETLPWFFTLKIPVPLRIGHEIFVVGEKRSQPELIK